MANVYSVSLGCPKNRVDTERLLASLPGVTLVDAVPEAHCVLINTCGFIDPAVRESVAAIAEAIEDIAACPANRKPLLVVAGCLVGRYGEKTLAPDLPEVDLWLDNRNLAAWSGLLRSTLAAAGHDAPPCATPLRLVSTGPSYAWMKISDGCDHTCSFCTIPFIRGAFVSTAAQDLVRESREILDSGIKELILVAQDTTAWGREFPANAAGNKGLMSLLDAILPLPGLARLRLMYLYPAGITQELLRYLKDAGSPFVPYFDIPVQHAHPDVLSRMGRPFARDPRISLDRVRGVFPDAALRTSIIVGFPGETDAQFASLYDFVREARFHHLGVFAYQAEEGTKAAVMPGQIPDSVKEERRSALMELQAEISAEIMEESVGETMEVLVDAPHPEWPGLFTGRTWFQAPEIDGITYISGPGVTPGALVTADITESRTYDLVALV